MAITQEVLTARDRAILIELEALVRETYQLWDQTWVGFSWRNYTYDHVMRVRNLARTIAARQNGNLRVLEFAATLHDVTKSYDGEILMRDGQRVLDADGFWINAKLPPVRQNRVTALYERLGLTETVHHYSGGQIATALLGEYGYDDEFCAAAREIILAHLKPLPTSTPAALSLYDADTIDANIGLPAFYRNIRITMHRMEQDYAKRGEDLDAYLATSLEAYLNVYLREKIPPWVEGKRRDFVEKLTTENGKAVARERIDHLSEDVARMVDEFDDFDANAQRGRLAIVRRFVERRDNPSLTAELADLSSRWTKETAPTDGALALIEGYRQEIDGLV
ncbi:MAG TPA: HD domain-containing protein [Chloroflexota bacterium]|nr:HD domain-containing protein [Chloroflexota bacterium]